MSLHVRAFRRAVRSFVRGSSRYFFGKPRLRSVSGWRTLYRLKIFVLIRTKDTFENLTPFRSVRVWVDREVFPRIIELLHRAEHTVVIQMFIWRDDEIGRRVATTILEAADRGVKVDITKEAIGDVFEFHRDFLATRHQKGEPLWQRFWTHPNIRITYAANNDHAKVYIIDGKTLLLTGMNVSDVYHYDLHDYLVELRGVRFVQKYLTRGELRDSGRVQLKMNTERVKEIRGTVMDLLRSARRSIVIEHCYISDPEVIDLLVKRSFEGVRITLITPERTELLHHFTNMETVSKLLSRASPSLRVFLFPGVFHAKILMVDKSKVFLGSANLMQSSMDEMGEVNVLLIGARQRALIKLRDILRGDILRSRLLTNPAKWRWVIRWLAWLKL